MPSAVYWEDDWSTSQRASYLAQVLAQFIENSLAEAVPRLGLVSRVFQSYRVLYSPD